MTKAANSPRSKSRPPTRDGELGRLADLMPASGRMWCRIISKPNQPEAIAVSAPKPWNRNCTIRINLTLWQQMLQGQRDLMLLRTVCWVTAIRWFQPGAYQGLLGASLAGAVVETFRGEATGIVLFAGLSVVAIRQVWTSFHGLAVEKEADEAAVRVATRRQYDAAAAANHLADAIKAVADIEGRVGTVNELLRCQALKALAQDGSDES